MAEANQPETNNPIGYEQSDWRIGWVGLTFAAVFVFLFIAPLVLIWAYSISVSDISRKLTIEPPPPRLQTNPSQDLANFEAAQDKALNSYYWVDKQKGLVHIPIAAAMKKLAEQGIDGFPKGSR